ncbi:MAG: hypothetical protein Q7R54_03190 [bacterium]|nr:hypothetical protein [bacterium]
MKKIVSITALLVFTFVLAVCSLFVSGQYEPVMAADVSSQSAKVYDRDMDTAWKAVLKALTSSGIAVVSASRESGQITTDYRSLGVSKVARGFLGSTTSRYKFTIFFISQEEGKTVVMVNPVIERATMAGGLADATTTPYLDISDKMSDTIVKMRGMIYEIIGPSLL